jgi:quercetin dioxygenase-like cupin family protein
VQLLRTELEGVPGQEVVITTTEWAPGHRLPWHVHPGGHEFAYILEGEMTYEVEGHGTTVVKAGELHHVLPRVPRFGRNAGTTRARTLVFRVKDRAQPISVPVSR